MEQSINLNDSYKCGDDDREDTTLVSADMIMEMSLEDCSIAKSVSQSFVSETIESAIANSREVSPTECSSPILGGPVDSNGAITSKPFIFQPPLQEERNVAVVGPFGVGKSCVICAILGILMAGYTGWRDGTVDNVLNKRDMGGFFLKLFDTKGLRGVRHHDWPILRKLVNDLSADAAKIDCAFLCFSSTRFSATNAEVLKILINMTTPEFQRCIHVVITHSPELRVHEEFKNDVVKRLSFLGATREEILARVHFVDLIHPDSFPVNSPGRVAILDNWATAQQDFYQTMLNTHEQVPVNRIFKMSYLEQFYFVYSATIHFAAVTFLLLLVGYALYHSLGMNVAQQQVIYACEVENTGLLRELSNVTNITRTSWGLLKLAVKKAFDEARMTFLPISF